MDEHLQIGDVAQRTGLSVDAVRYYERVGILPRVARRASGYRTFTTDAVRRLRFVRHARQLGFTLDDVRELLALRVGRPGACAEVRARTLSKRAEVDARIRELERIHDALTRLAASCHGAGPRSECPLLDLLERIDARVTDDAVARTRSGERRIEP